MLLCSVRRHRYINHNSDEIGPIVQKKIIYPSPHVGEIFLFSHISSCFHLSSVKTSILRRVRRPPLCRLLATKTVRPSCDSKSWKRISSFCQWLREGDVQWYTWIQSIRVPRVPKDPIYLLIYFSTSLLIYLSMDNGLQV